MDTQHTQHTQHTLDTVVTAFKEFTDLRMRGAVEALENMQQKPRHAEILLSKGYSAREVAKDLIRDTRSSMKS